MISCVISFAPHPILERKMPPPPQPARRPTATFKDGVRPPSRRATEPGVPVHPAQPKPKKRTATESTGPASHQFLGELNSRLGGGGKDKAPAVRALSPLTERRPALPAGSKPALATGPAAELAFSTGSARPPPKPTRAAKKPPPARVPVTAALGGRETRDGVSGSADSGPPEDTSFCFELDRTQAEHLLAKEGRNGSYLVCFKERPSPGRGASYAASLRVAPSVQGIQHSIIEFGPSGEVTIEAEKVPSLSSGGRCELIKAVEYLVGQWKSQGCHVGALLRAPAPGKQPKPVPPPLRLAPREQPAKALPDLSSEPLPLLPKIASNAVPATVMDDVPLPPAWWTKEAEVAGRAQKRFFVLSDEKATIEYFEDDNIATKLSKGLIRLELATKVTCSPRDGRLEIACPDRIWKLKGQSDETVTLWGKRIKKLIPKLAVLGLKMTADDLDAMLAQIKPPTSSRKEPELPLEHRTVMLQRAGNTARFGVKFEHHEGRGDGTIICSVADDGAAAGQLMPGETVLSINGEHLGGLTFSEGVSIMQSVMGSTWSLLKLVVRSKPRYVRAAEDFVAEGDDELTIFAGDRIRIAGEPVNGWMRGLAWGKHGWFPHDLVDPEPISGSSEFDDDDDGYLQPVRRSSQATGLAAIVGPPDQHHNPMILDTENETYETYESYDMPHKPPAPPARGESRVASQQGRDRYAIGATKLLTRRTQRTLELSTFQRSENCMPIYVFTSYVFTLGGLLDHASV